jgi:hypothetical protein
MDTYGRSELEAEGAAGDADAEVEAVDAVGGCDGCVEEEAAEVEEELNSAEAGSAALVFHTDITGIGTGAAEADDALLFPPSCCMSPSSAGCTARDALAAAMASLTVLCSGKTPGLSPSDFLSIAASSSLLTRSSARAGSCR